MLVNPSRSRLYSTRLQACLPTVNSMFVARISPITDKFRFGVSLGLRGSKSARFHLALMSGVV
jgi:hypothetical protein